MNWYWKVRLYDTNGHYRHGQIVTGKSLQEIDNFKETYEILTGCKMLLEGMSEREDENIGTIQEAFAGLWVAKTPG